MKEKKHFDAAFLFIICSLKYYFLYLGDRLATIMNDALNPDTEFLLPTSPLLLTPIPLSTIPNTNSTTAEAKTNDVNESPPTYTQLKWDDQAAANNSKVPTALPDVSNDQNIEANNPTDVLPPDLSTNILNPTNELEVVIASDYETASESPSPSTNQESESSEIHTEERGLNMDASAPEESPSIDLSSSAVTEGLYTCCKIYFVNKIGVLVCMYVQPFNVIFFTLL